MMSHSLCFGIQSGVGKLNGATSGLMRGGRVSRESLIDLRARARIGFFESDDSLASESERNPQRIPLANRSKVAWRRGMIPLFGGEETVSSSDASVEVEDDCTFSVSHLCRERDESASPAETSGVRGEPVVKTTKMRWRRRGMLPVYDGEEKLVLEVPSNGVVEELHLSCGKSLFDSMLPSIPMEDESFSLREHQRMLRREAERQLRSWSTERELD